QNQWPGWKSRTLPEIGPGPEVRVSAAESPLRLAIRSVEFQILRDQTLPAVAVVQQARLVIEQFFAGLGGELAVRSLDDGVHRAGLLAQTAVDAFDHDDVVARRAAAAVSARFGLDGDGLGGADGLAQLAGDAAFFAVRIAAQRVFATETRRLRVALERIVHRGLRLGHVLQRQADSAEHVGQHRALGRLNDTGQHYDFAPAHSR